MFSEINFFLDCPILDQLGPRPSPILLIFSPRSIFNAFEIYSRRGRTRQYSAFRDQIPLVKSLLDRIHFSSGPGKIYRSGPKPLPVKYSAVGAFQTFLPYDNVVIPNAVAKWSMSGAFLRRNKVLSPGVQDYLRFLIEFVSWK